MDHQPLSHSTRGENNTNGMNHRPSSSRINLNVNVKRKLATRMSNDLLNDLSHIAPASLVANHAKATQKMCARGGGGEEEGGGSMEATK